MPIYYEDGALNVGAKASLRRERATTDVHRANQPSPSGVALWLVLTVTIMRAMTA